MEFGHPSDKTVQSCKDEGLATNQALTTTSRNIQKDVTSLFLVQNLRANLGLDIATLVYIYSSDDRKKCLSGPRVAENHLSEKKRNTMASF
jgi:hypothetical protein